MVDNNQEYRLVLGHSLVRSLVCSHRSLVCLLRSARFARALCYALSFAHSLARGKKGFYMKCTRCEHSVSTHCDLVVGVVVVGVVVVSGVAEARSIVRHHAVIVKS